MALVLIENSVCKKHVGAVLTIVLDSLFPRLLGGIVPPVFALQFSLYDRCYVCLHLYVHELYVVYEVRFGLYLARTNLDLPTT